MATWIVVLLFSVGAVLFLVVGLSLTLMIKGHHIDGEISTNRHMRARGITCAVHDAAHVPGPTPPSCQGVVADNLCSDKTCAACATND